MIEEQSVRSGEGLDWARVRGDFPVTESMAYLSSAATGPVSRVVAETAAGFYREVMTQGDRRWDEWMAMREEAREQIARLINAEPDEIGFTTNTTGGMNLIIDALEGRPGEVISCELEFPVSTFPWLHRGRVVKLLKARGGVLTPEDVTGAMTDRTSVICLSHVQFSNGLRSDLEELGRNKGRHAFVVNASQSAGVLPIDVKRMGIDALCSTGHKWMLAGYGSGFVYMSRALLEESRARAIGWMSVENAYATMPNDRFTVRRGAGARAETGCPHFANIFALGAAAEYVLKIGTREIEARALGLNRLLTERLDAAGWRVLSPIGDELTRSAETLVEAESPPRLVRHLAARGVVVTTKPEGIRVATHFFNDEADIERLINGLREWRDAG